MTKGSKADEIFTLIFMLLAIAAVVCFCIPSVDRTVFLSLGGVAVVLRLVQYVLRFMH